MADRISDLAVAQALVGTELVEVSQDVGGGLNSRQLALSVLLGWFKANGIKHHVDTRDPTVNDDETQGFSGVGPESSGSIWVNESGDGEIFRCTSAAVGAARWINTSLTLDELGSMALVDDAPSDGEIYARKDGGWQKLGTAATAQFNRMPFANLLGYSGRFADMSGHIDGQFGLRLMASPFDKTSFFVAYNGSTFASVGQFIHDNTDFGGNAGNMTQTTVDLINAMGRAGYEGRYGVEFYIMEIAAGLGTAASLTGSSGDLYLMATNGSKAMFAFEGLASFSGWVRAIDGEIGLWGTSDWVFTAVNGVPEPAPYLLSPAQGWVYVEAIRQQVFGYDASFPRFYGERGVSKVQIACPAVFSGYVRTGGHVSPVPSAGTIL